MSGEGPESIPTSADPRSRRPTKKRALTPVSAQSASVSALFARPEQEIRMPPPLTSSSTSSGGGLGKGGRPPLPPPPEIVTNVQGSSAGAGSGEFHVYKASRRREYERLRRMDEEARRERADEQFEQDRAEKERRDEERTRRNREKREKKKGKRAKGKGDEAPAKNKWEGGGVKAAAPRDEEEVGGLENGKLAEENAEAGVIIHDDD